MLTAQGLEKEGASLTLYRCEYENSKLRSSLLAIIDNAQAKLEKLQAERLCGIRTQEVDANGWCRLKVPVLRCDQAPNLLHAAHQLYPNNHPP
jgi:hypothetical protein